MTQTLLAITPEGNRLLAIMDELRNNGKPL